MKRAKKGSVVCGNANKFVISELWSQFVYFYKRNNAIFTGGLGNLKMHRISTRKVEPYAIRKKIKYLDQDENNFYECRHSEEFYKCCSNAD